MAQTHSNRGIVLPGILFGLGLVGSLLAICTLIIEYNWYMSAQHYKYLKSSAAIEQTRNDRLERFDPQQDCSPAYCLSAATSASGLVSVHPLLGRLEFSGCTVQDVAMQAPDKGTLTHPYTCKTNSVLERSLHIGGNLRSSFLGKSSTATTYLLVDGWSDLDHLQHNAGSLILISAGSIHIGVLESTMMSSLTLISATGDIHIGELIGGSAITLFSAGASSIPAGVLVQQLSEPTGLLQPVFLMSADSAD